jgi:ferric-dicitrate binding protein FerR (iron transport regulator)
MTPETRIELEGLISVLCDGQLSEEEHARLESLLNDYPEARRIYLEYMDVHASLAINPERTGKPAAPAAEPDAAVATPSSGFLNWGRRNISQAFLVLGTLAASLLIQFFWTSYANHTAQKEQPEIALPARKDTYVATLVRGVNCVWEMPREPVGNGARLLPGILRLPKGVASIRFDGGAELILEGPAEVNVDSANAVTVLSGKVVLHASGSGAPFDLRTPSSTLVDIATDFGVAVTPEAEEVHVFEGELQRLSKKGAQTGAEPESLKAGESRRYEMGSDRAEKPAMDTKQFVRFVPEVSKQARDPNAGLLAYEGFAYDRPMSLQNGKAIGGIGWAGPWRASFVRPGPKAEFGRFSLNVKESLHRADAITDSVGGSFDYSGFAKTFRKLAQPIKLDSDDAYYLSFLFRRQGANDPSDSLAILFWTDEDYQQQNFLDFRKRLYIGMKGSNLSARLQRMNITRSMPLTKETTYLMVAKIAAGRSKPEQIFVRVYAPEEPVEAEETAAWSVHSPPFRSELAFEWLELSINGKSRQAIDEIRVGKTWESATAPWLSKKGPPPLIQLNP